MRTKILMALSIIALFILSCNTERKGGIKIIYSDKDNPYGEKLPPFRLNPDSLLTINFNQDLNAKSLSELRFLRSSVFARNGQLFKEPEIRNYFSKKYKWYPAVTTEIWSRIGDKIVDEPEITKPERDFVKKVDALIEEKRRDNYTDVNGNKLATNKNIVNFNEFEKLSPEFFEKLAQNNFVIIPENCPQLFNIYEQNDYNEIPGFVTSDLYLQLLHMYFSYTLRSLEKEHFTMQAERLSEQMCSASAEIAQKTADPRIKELAEFNQVFFSIPYALLSGNQTMAPKKYKKMFDSEMENIMQTEDKQSKLLDYFPYMIFKPRGHYTLNDTTKNYFRAMMWFQTAPFCLESPDQLKHAIFMAYLLNIAEKNMQGDYQSLYETISYLIGEPDNISVMDVANILRDLKINDLSKLCSNETTTKISAQLALLAKEKNRIKPKIILTCPDKINFLPQRYVFDNEILQDLVDTTENAARAFPRGLDIWATLGNKTSEDILFNTLKDGDKWKLYRLNLERLKSKMSTFSDWDKSIYNKWFECLKELQGKNKEMPPFMQTRAWDVKELNTSLASWAELKHDAILYAEQPSGAEMGGGPMPPEPIIKGYVEPNEAFWTKTIEMVSLSQKLLQKHHLMTESIQKASDKINEQLSFMLKTTQKELHHESLSEEENLYIRNIGGHVDNLTLSILEPGSKASSWYEVKTLDTSVSVIADVYNRNIPYCPKNGILYEAVGPVNNIYVVVEIDGFLYLTHGAVFSHYEFVEQDNQRLTDELWQGRISSKKLPPDHEWLKYLLLPAKKKPVVNETQLYR
jgi:hypothetical protein